MNKNWYELWNIDTSYRYGKGCDNLEEAVATVEGMIEQFNAHRRDTGEELPLPVVLVFQDEVNMRTSYGSGVHFERGHRIYSAKSFLQTVRIKEQTKTLKNGEWGQV